MKKQKTPVITSGITITDNISLKFPKRRALSDSIMLIIIALMGCIGVINSFSTMFQIDISTSTLNFYTISSFILFSVIFILPKKFMISLVPILLIYQFLIYIKWKNYENGFQLITNQVYSVLFPKRSDYFRIDTDLINVPADTKLFLAFTVFLLCGLICYFTIVRPNFTLGFLFTFPFLELGLYHGKSPSLLPAFILLIYWTALLSASQSGHCQNYGRSKMGFTRYENDFIAKPAIKFSTAGQSGIIMLSGAVIIISLTALIINISGYTRSEKLNEVKNNVRVAVSEFDFNDLNGSLKKLSASFGIGNFMIDNHKLGNVSSVPLRGTKQLTVTVEGNDIPNNHIYLKGYVGSIYDGKSWSEHNVSVYDNASWNEKYEPQNILYKTYGERLKIYTELYPTEFSLSINPTFLNGKYTYTPYNAMLDGDYECIDDTILKTKNKKDYSFSTSYYQDFESLLSNYSVFKSSDYFDYSNFAYKNYLDVPNNDETQKLYNLFIKDITETDTLSKLETIKSILDENASYTLKPGKTPSDKDFVSYFLTENHKGYCVHFATSGVILARMAGIPARYAEGFVVFENDFNEKSKTENGYKIEVTDERAHAWAEIYIDGCGWIPFEFTPPSYVSTLIEQSNKNDDEVSTSTITTSSKTTTTQTVQTTFKNIHNENSTSTQNNKVVIHLSTEMKIVLIWIAGIIILITVIFIVHKIVIIKRLKSFNTKSNSQNAVNVYNYIIDLLKFCNVTNNNMQYLEFADFIENEHPRLFRNNEFTIATQIMLEALLSGKEISEDKVSTMINTANKFAFNIFRRKNVLERFYMKFIKNLC